MMRIAICDDNRQICSQMEAHLERIGEIEQEDFDIRAFHGGDTFYSSLLQGERFELVFLDIEMERLDGIKTGQKIRQAFPNPLMQIIYISGKESYAMELFRIQPFDFLIKPISFERLEEVFWAVRNRIYAGRQVFEYDSNNQRHRIAAGDILYFESDGKKIRIVMLEGEHSFYEKLSQVEKQLNPQDFLRIHKSYLINYNHAVEIHYEEVILFNGQRLPISRANRSRIRQIQMAKMRAMHGKSNQEAADGE